MRLRVFEWFIIVGFVWLGFEISRFSKHPWLAGLGASAVLLIVMLVLSHMAH